MDTITRTRCVQLGNMLVCQKDVNNWRFNVGLQVISGQYQTNRLVGLKTYRGTNWIYISPITADYRLSLHVRLHVTLSFGGPSKSRLYLKTIFQTHFLHVFYIRCQQVAPENLFLRWIEKYFKPVLCRGTSN